MKLGGRRLSIVPTAQHSTRGHAHPGQGKLSLGVSEPVDDENYISEVDMGFTYPATDALPSLGVELSMAHAQEAGLAGQIAPPAAVPLPRERAAKTTGLLGGARGDRNHDLMLVGVRVRKLVRSRVPGPRLVVTEYLVVGVDMVQQHAYDVEDLQGARLKTDLPRRLMRAPDELLERQGEWQPLPHQSSIVPLRPTAFFCATCMLQSSHKPCVLCSGSDGTPEHMLLNVSSLIVWPTLSRGRVVAQKLSSRHLIRNSRQQRCQRVHKNWWQLASLKPLSSRRLRTCMGPPS